MRDDLLGVFGDPAVTGKTAVDDLRKGKHTVLLAAALRLADAHSRSILQGLVGQPDLNEDGAARAQAITDSSGARALVEDVIATRYQQALEALSKAPISTTAAAVLREVAALAADRGF
ncbi:polyprenyl synthetase family protein [Streptomyces sp. NPDC048295]|uniref:polyprenyl synthetase family protein n=1 Tax=Streptomyces sp. NPDC048295 TaxID=3154617 RepID=UPI00342024CB